MIKLADRARCRNDPARRIFSSLICLNFASISNTEVMSDIGQWINIQIDNLILEMSVIAPQSIQDGGFHSYHFKVVNVIHYAKDRNVVAYHWDWWRQAFHTGLL
jgi:hypothetical protein